MPRYPGTSSPQLLLLARFLRSAETCANRSWCNKSNKRELFGARAWPDPHAVCPQWTEALPPPQAHAAVWHLYDRHYRPRQSGQLSIALASHWINPSRTRLESLRECQCSLNHVLGWFARPLFIDGEYPACMRERLGPRLPSFSPEEREQVRQTADFFALSYGAVLSFHLINDSLKFGQHEDLDLRKLLYWVSAEYNNPPIFVVQSGW